MKGTVIPRRLQEARAEHGLSHKELGIRAGFDEFVASARMNQYERGSSFSQLCDLAQDSRGFEG